MGIKPAHFLDVIHLGIAVCTGIAIGVFTKVNILDGKLDKDKEGKQR